MKTPLIVFLIVCITCTLAAQVNDPFGERKAVYGDFQYKTDVNTYVFDLSTLAIFQNGYKLSTEEFRYRFKPTNGDSTNRAKQNFLDNLVLMKQKVFLGMNRGIDTSAAFRKELDGYRKQIMAPWLGKGYTKEEALAEPEVKWTVMSYYEGIVLFDLMDKDVWSKAVKDTAGTRKFYEDHKVQYGGKRFSSVLSTVITDYQHQLEEELGETAIAACQARINRAVASHL